MDVLKIEGAEWAYAAGILDGEGSIHSSGGGPWVQVKIGMTCEATITWLATKFGGKVQRSTLPRGNILYCWYRSGFDALHFLEGVRPYCITKRDRVEVGIALARTIRSRTRNGSDPVSDHDRVLRFRLQTLLKELNGGSKRDRPALEQHP